MAAENGTQCANRQSDLKPAEMGVGISDETSRESWPPSPLYNNDLDYTYCNHLLERLQNTYPAHDPVTAAAIGLIPLEIDIEGLYDTEDRRRKKNSSENVVSPLTHARRRAQNRASQRAFRERKMKKMQEIEERLVELQVQHEDLTRSYQALQVEYASAKQELNLRRRLHENRSAARGSYVASSIIEVEKHCTEDSDPLLFDVSVFCYEMEDESE